MALSRAKTKLSKYGGMRRFDRTTEPAPRVGRTRSGRSFVVQKHDASRLHYDFRLEFDGVLKSWAVPKGPSLDPSQRVLAVQVEDHPVAYGSFEGTIPKGQYGGGTVLLWDRGTWEPVGDPAQGLRTGKLKFKLNGKKLRGGWTLVRMHGRAGDEGKNWLLIKEKDEAARATSQGDVRTDEPLSVATGRDMEDIAGATGPVWNSKPRSPGRSMSSLPRGPGRRAGSRGAGASARSRAAGATTRAHRTKRAKSAGSAALGQDPAAMSGARKASMPKSPSPQLATLVAEAPAGESWLHEIKFDGYRVLCRLEKGRVQLLTRRGNDWTDRFEAIASSARELGAGTAILDGEVVVLSESGRSDFQSLQNALKGVEPGAELVYFIFDLLYLNGYDLMDVPLLDRRRLLQRLLEGTPAGNLRYSEHVQGSGKAVVGQACRNGLEGIVSKRADSPYRPGRGREWVKVKCVNRQEFVIGGYTEPGGARKGFGALLLGCYNADGDLAYCGRVGTGFDQKTLASVLKELMRNKTERTPFKNPPRGAEARGVHWLAPKLVAEVQFSEWTRDGTLRHPSFQGLREDKDPRAVVREKPASAPKDHPGRAGASGPRTPAVGGSSSDQARTAIAGVTISNPGRVLYPEVGITKLELARYYETIKDWVLPHMIHRPLTMVRCPQGRQGACFYQKHIGERMPESVHGVMIREKDGKEDQYVAIEDLAGLIGLVQLGVLEFHPWGCHEDDVEKPDRLIIDLDPGPGVAWGRVVDAARLVRERLENTGLVSFVKTTGGKGLHVVLPLQRRATWDQAKAFTKTIAEGIVRDHPDQYTAIMTKSRRKDKIFIDYLRNGRGATAVAPYSTRAREGAPVATPLAWEELSPKVQPEVFTLRTVPQRLGKLKKDPWEGMSQARQTISAGMLKER